MLSISVVCYLFLGGAGAGACLVLSCLGLLSPTTLLAQNSEKTFQPSTTYRRFFVPSFVAAIVFLFVGTFCLLVDLGRIDRVLNLFTMPTFSYLSIGTYALTLLILLAFVGIVMWSGGFRRIGIPLVRALQIAGIIVALFVMIYTGLLLQSMGTVSFWETPLVPVLFVLSSASTGIALIAGLACFTGAFSDFATTIKRLITVDVALIVAEVAVLAIMLALALGQGDASASAHMLINGGLSLVFWGALVLCGLLVPLVLEVVSFTSPSQTLMIVVSALILIGGFALRYCIASAGAYTPIAFIAGA